MEKTIRKRWQIILVTVFVLAALTLMYYVRNVLNPFLLGLVLAYILNPVINWMEKKGAPRKSSVILIFTLLITIFLAVSVILIPVISHETKTWYISFLGEPFEDANNNGKFDKESEAASWVDTNNDGKFNKGYIAKLRDKLTDYQEGKGSISSFATNFMSKEQYEKVIKNAMNSIKENLSDIFTNIQSVLQAAITQGMSAAGWISNFFFYLITTPIYMAFLLYSMNSGWNKFTGYIPAAVKPKFLKITRKIDIVMGAFFRGRLMVCIAISIFTSIGFYIVGVKFGIFFGLMIGVCSFIPFLNIVPFIGVLLMCWIDGMGWGGFAAVIIVHSIGQTIDPLIMTLVTGKELALHPVTILLSMFICSSLLGFFGMLLAVPIGAISKILFVEFVAPHLKELAGETAA